MRSQRSSDPKTDHPIDALELEANGYVVVSQEVIEHYERLLAVASATVAGEATLDDLAAAIRG